MSILRITSAAVVLILGAAGRKQIEPAADWISTDSVSYTARPLRRTAPATFAFRLVARFENKGHVDAYLARCYPTSPQPLFGITHDEVTGAESAYEQFWACVGHGKQFRVPPGGVRVDTFRITGPTSFSGNNKVGYGRLEGRFRLFYRMATEPGEVSADRSRPLVYTTQPSNVFSVRLATLRP